MNYETLIIEKKDGAAFIYLNRPEIHNAFNPDLIRELHDLFRILGADDTVRAIVLSGKGKSFCAGADLNWMKSTAGYTFEENRADALKMAAMFEVVNNCPKPVIGRINGAAIGGGMGLVAVCDAVIASESARFGFSEVKLGLTPAVISSFVISKIGFSHARALFLTGERFSAARAKVIGLAHETVPLEQLDNRVNRLIKGCLTSAPGAVAAAKEMVQSLVPFETSTILQINAVRIAQLRAGAEGQEGMSAFLEKRKPSWRMD
ncbi:MAG: enoyl-CoA hydratase [Candidatus Cloacimonetes bacterium 4572_55]|nr:MAG: enoyl-CoA hydratase [Candidatus Cloacimonetes bacterium 4572_55]